MVPAAQIVSISCAFVLCLGLSNLTGAAETELGLSTGVEDVGSCTDKNVEREVGVMKCREKLAARGVEGTDTVRGRVLRVDGNDYLIQRSEGGEVRLHADGNTQRTQYITPGDRIEAKVNPMNHDQVLYIRPTN